LRRTVGHVKAVNAATVNVREGETLGIVGESGSGKTTLALAVLRLISSDGPVVFMGRDIQGLKSRELKDTRRDMQVVFQDPYGSLSPRMTIEQIVAEGADRPRHRAGRAAQPRGGDPAGGRAASVDDGPLPARVFRRAAAAHRDRARHDPAPAPGGAR
jgi:ABC-type microcin C transport system duplicated ATPase subunit YejF